MGRISNHGGNTKPHTPTADRVRAAVKKATGRDDLTAVIRAFAIILKSYAAAFLLRQIIYWTDRTEDPSGRFYKSTDDWYLELGIRRDQLARSRKKLSKVGVTTERRRLNGAVTVTTFYRLDAEILISSI